MQAGQDGFELLALKWEPKLSKRQAQELSPFEIGDREWQSSVQSLTSTPALVLALRRVRAFTTLRSLLPQNYPENLHVLMSPTPETAFRQTCLFFTEAELVPGEDSTNTSLVGMIFFSFVPNAVYLSIFIFRSQQSSIIEIPTTSSH